MVVPSSGIWISSSSSEDHGDRCLRIRKWHSSSWSLWSSLLHSNTRRQQQILTWYSEEYGNNCVFLDCFVHPYASMGPDPSGKQTSSRLTELRRYVNTATYLSSPIQSPNRRTLWGTRHSMHVCDLSEKCVVTLDRIMWGCSNSQNNFCYQRLIMLTIECLQILQGFLFMAS